MTLQLFQVHSYIALKQFRYEFSAFSSSRECASLRFEIISRANFYIFDWNQFENQLLYPKFTDKAPMFRMKV
jgi:hypothetical protein